MKIFAFACNFSARMVKSSHFYTQTHLYTHSKGKIFHFKVNSIDLKMSLRDITPLLHHISILLLNFLQLLCVCFFYCWLRHNQSHSKSINSFVVLLFPSYLCFAENLLLINVPLSKLFNNRIATNRLQSNPIQTK